MNQPCLIKEPFKEVIVMAKSKGSKARSAITGRYVTKAHAKRNPKTTVVEKTKSSKRK